MYSDSPDKQFSDGLLLALKQHTFKSVASQIFKTCIHWCSYGRLVFN